MTKLGDGAISAHRAFLRDVTFAQIYSAWESKAPSIRLTGADGKVDLHATALTGAHAEGYRQAMKNFLELTNIK